MYTIIKKLEISASHKLKLSYNSKCENLHGHNWIVYIYLKSDKLNENSMVYDFMDMKKSIMDKLDHKNLNNIVEQPTAENIAKFICDEIGQQCYRVTVQESEGNTAIYER